MKISDGLGGGYEAGVSSRGMVLVQSVNRSQVQDGAFSGRTFSLGSGPITLTSANETAIFYIRNDHPTDWCQLETAEISTGPSTAGTGSMRIRAYANPTAGTLLTSGTLAVAGALTGAFMNCANLSSRITPQLTVRAGVEGQTQTGASSLFASRQWMPSSAINSSVPAVLGPGASLVWTVTPPTSNTSLVLSVTAIITFVPKEEVGY